jgi:hypothetical protein
MNNNEWVGTAPEHPLSAHDWQWVSIEHHLNTHWVCTNANEWVWTLVSAHDCHWVIIECDSPWCDHVKVLICVRTEHSLNTCECAWTPLGQYWTHPECLVLVSVHEHLWVSMEHPLNTCEYMWTTLSENWTHPECLWIFVNANEWVGTSREHSLSNHECLWVSIRKVWMCSSRVVN